MKKNKHTLTRFISSEVEALFAIDLPKIESKILSHVSEVALNPSLKLSYVLEELSAEFSRLESQVKSILQPALEKAKLKASLKEIEDKKDHIKSKIKEVAARVASSRYDLSTKKVPFNRPRVFLASLGILLLLGFDGLINFRSFQMLLDNLLQSTIASFIVVMTLAVAAHITGQKMKEKGKKARLIGFCAIVLAFIIFYLLGVLRSEYMEAISGSPEGLTSPLTWAGINTGFFAFAVYLSFAEIPSKSDWKILFDRIRIKKELYQHEYSKRALESELDQMRQATNENLENLRAIEIAREDYLSKLSSEKRLLTVKVKKDFHMRGGLSKHNLN